MEPRKKRIVLAADTSHLAELIDWAQFYRDLLTEFDICTTDAAFNQLVQTLNIKIRRFQGRNPEHNGHKKLEDYINGDFDFLVLFVESNDQPLDDPEIKALLNSAAIRNIPIAGNRAAADVMFPYCLMHSD